MKRIDEEGIKRFVYYDSGKALSPDMMGGVLVYLGIFSFIGMVAGIVMGGAYLVLSLLMLALTIAYAVLSAVLKERLKPSLRADLLCNCIVSAFSMVFFFLVGLLLFIMSGPDPLQWLVLAAAYLLAFALYCLVLMRMIRRDADGKKRPRSGSAAAFSVLGFVVGSAAARAFLPNAGQDVALFVGYSCFFLVSVVFSWGLINIPKYYYCAKYSVPDIFYEPKKGARKDPKKTASKEDPSDRAE